MHEYDETDHRRRPRILGLADRRENFMRDPDDSSLACRERAKADLNKLTGDMPMNARRVLETSARSWLARAELLERLEKSFAARACEADEGD